MLKKISNSKVLKVFGLLLILVSCDSKRVYDEYTSIDNNKWEINTPVTYQFEVKDTLAKRNLFINIRNNSDYEYSNLFLVTKMSFPDGHKIVDTLEYDMADKNGKFLGKGFSELKESKLFYKEQILFPIQGSYTLDIFQAMRKGGEVEGINELDGIVNVGFRIEKIN
ncbi:gliding motility lipoprotein GldH [Tenacibaculum sp. 190524A05c]|uniref:Gliding motility lipoprotein GldH homolog n=1 Tax=Tenacibaculum platacis TaxID=3137852 RepID=A0ABP1EJ61_9FLAO